MTPASQLCIFVDKMFANEPTIVVFLLVTVALMWVVAKLLDI